MTVGGSDARWATSDLINERLDFKFLRDPFGLTQSVIAITAESYAPTVTRHSTDLCVLVTGLRKNQEE